MNNYSFKDVETLIDNSVSRISAKLTNDPASIKEKLKELCDASGMNELFNDLFGVFQWDKVLADKTLAKGFPGIVIVSVIGRLLDDKYMPASEFYYCSPRSLFEKNIGPILRDKYGAPMGKSDPLNVAKNQNVIDENWAEGKRPETAALASVNLISWTSDANREDLERFLDLLVWSYISLSKLFTREMPDIPPGLDLRQTHALVSTLIDKATAGGETAQTIVGLLLKVQYDVFECEQPIMGLGESVSATTTTSKSAGDFAEALYDQLHIYEVTTKSINEQRVSDCSDSISKFIEEDDSKGYTYLEVTFLCRDNDVEFRDGDGNRLTSIVHNEIKYNFLNIYSWILILLERIGPKGRIDFVNSLKEYVQKSGTKLEVKKEWEEIIKSID